MENEDKRPEVWVARRLLRRKGSYYEPEVIAFFASKARVQTVTKTFLRNGQEVKECEVEYETPKELEDLCFDGHYDVYAETGDYVKHSIIFKNYADCREVVDALNRKLIRTYLSRTVVADEKVVVEGHNRNVAYAKKLENYFDKAYNPEQREL